MVQVGLRENVRQLTPTFIWVTYYMDSAFEWSNALYGAGFVWSSAFKWRAEEHNRELQRA